MEPINVPIKVSLDFLANNNEFEVLEYHCKFFLIRVETRELNRRADKEHINDCQLPHHKYALRNNFICEMKFKHLCV